MWQLKAWHAEVSQNTYVCEAVPAHFADVPAMQASQGLKVKNKWTSKTCLTGVSKMVSNDNLELDAVWEHFWVLEGNV